MRHQRAWTIENEMRAVSWRNGTTSWSTLWTKKLKRFCARPRIKWPQGYSSIHSLAFSSTSRLDISTISNIYLPHLRPKTVCSSRSATRTQVATIEMRLRHRHSINKSQQRCASNRRPPKTWEWQMFESEKTFTFYRIEWEKYRMSMHCTGTVADHHICIRPWICVKLFN